MKNSKRIWDDNHFYTIEDNKIARSGIFKYLGKEIGAPEPNKIYNVYRPAEELDNEETLNSFKLLPWFIQHAEFSPSSEYNQADDMGVHGIVGENVYYDSNDKFLKATIKAFTKDLKDFIDNEGNELSIGYTSIFEPEDGIFEGEKYQYRQSNIKGTHLASVEEGRAGKKVAVSDSNINNEDINMDKKEIKDMIDECLSEMKDNIMKEVKDELSKEVKKEEEEVKDEKEVEKEEVKDEKEESEMKEEEKESEDKISFEKVPESAIGDAVNSYLNKMKKEELKKESLAKDLYPHIGYFDTSEKSIETIALEGAEKFGLSTKKEGLVDRMEGYLYALNKNANSQPLMASDSSEKKNDVNDIIEKFNKGVS